MCNMIDYSSNPTTLFCSSQLNLRGKTNLQVETHSNRSADIYCCLILGLVSPELDPDPARPSWAIRSGCQLTFKRVLAAADAKLDARIELKIDLDPHMHCLPSTAPSLPPLWCRLMLGHWTPLSSGTKTNILRLFIWTTTTTMPDLKRLPWCDPLSYCDMPKPCLWCHNLYNLTSSLAWTYTIASSSPKGMPYSLTLNCEIVRGDHRSNYIPATHTFTLIFQLWCSKKTCGEEKGIHDPHRILGNLHMRSTNGNGLPKRRGLRVLSWNCGGGFLTKGKKLELESFMRKNKVDIAGIQEVEATKTKFFYEDLYKIKGYKTVFPKSLQKHKSSRAIVYYKENMEDVINVRLDLMLETQPTIWLQLKGGRRCLFAFTYREFNSVIDGEGDMEAQRRRLKDLVEKAKVASATGSEIFWSGDFNMKAEDICEGGRMGDSLPGIMSDFNREEGFQQLIKVKTRTRIVDQAIQSSAIDHIYTNNKEAVRLIKVQETSISDHALVTFSIQLSWSSPAKEITVRSFKNFVKEDFLSSLGEVHWESELEDKPVDDCVNTYTEMVTKALDKHAPKITFKPKSSFNPTLSSATVAWIKKREEAYKKAKLTKQESDIKDWKELRNKVVGIIAKEKKENRVIEFSRPGDAWKAMNVMRNKVKSQNGPPTKLIIEGKEVTDDRKMANAMNKFFVEKVLKLKEEVAKEAKPYDPIEHLNKHLPENMPTFAFEPVTEEMVSDAISKLKSTKTSGSDGISNQTLQAGGTILARPLSIIFNRSLESGTFPRRWTHAIVVPLWKKKAKTDPKNYRPVSLTCKTGILFEKLLNKQLASHLKKEHLIPEEQDGYQTGKSTTTLTCRAYDRWCRAKNSNKQVGAILVDLSSAFCLISLEVLLGKAESIGASRLTTQWLRSYLSGRTQTVRIGKELSEVRNIPSCITQGTSFGPLLFILATIDLPRCVTHGEVDLFCDDITDTVIDNDAQVVAGKLEADAKNITDWLISNELCLARDKTSWVIFKGRRRKRGTGTEKRTIVVGGETVEESKTVKLLGVIFDQDLSFTSHLHGIKNEEKGLINKLTNILGVVRRITHCPRKARLMFISSLFNSKLIYGLETYGGLNEGQLNHLQSIQNRAARMVSPHQWLLEKKSPQQTLQDLNWLSIRGLREMLDITTIWKMKKYDSSPYFNKWMRSKRLPAHALIPTYDQDFNATLKRSFFPRASLEWNSTPLSIRSEESLARFKKMLKEHMMMKERLTQT